MRGEINTSGENSGEKERERRKGDGGGEVKAEMRAAQGTRWRAALEGGDCCWFWVEHGFRFSGCRLEFDQGMDEEKDSQLV